MTRTQAILGVVLGCASLSAAMCNPSDTPPEPLVPPAGALDGGTKDSAQSNADANGDAKDAEAGLPEPDVKTPPGWHRWPYPPSDCAVFVPDDLSAVQPLAFVPCPFQPDGCRRATWANQHGDGFGGAVTATRVGQSVYVRASRILDDGWAEILLTRDETLTAAWRYHPNGRCSIGVWAGEDAKMVTILHRWSAEIWPWVLFNDIVSPVGAPYRVETFGPPDAAVVPSNVLSRSDRLLVVFEDGRRFGVRDLLTGATERPSPSSGDFIYLESPTPVGATVYYWSWNAKQGTIWAWRADTGSVPVLKDDVYSYDAFVSDGKHGIWLRSKDKLAEHTFQTVELFASELSEEPTTLNPVLVSADVGNHVVPLTVGDGWAAIQIAGDDVRLYPINGGAPKRLPAVEEFGWSASQYHGMSIAGGEVWVTGRLVQGNAARYLTRFELSQLPNL
jgi:hypothetical protein